MFLKKIKILNLKNIERIEYVFSNKKTLISGSFGKGKTTIFESIYFSNFLLLNPFRKNLIQLNKTYSAIYCDVLENDFEYKLKTFIQDNKITFYKNEKIIKLQKKQKYIFCFFVSLFEDVFKDKEKQKMFFYEEILRNYLDFFDIKELFEKDFQNWFDIVCDKSKNFSIDKVKKIEKNMTERVLLIKSNLYFLSKEIFKKFQEITKDFNYFSFLKLFLNQKYEFKFNFEKEHKEIKEFWIKFRDDKFKKISFFDFCFKGFKSFFDLNYLDFFSLKEQKIILIFLKLAAAKFYFFSIKKRFVFCIDDFDIFSINTQEKILKSFPINIQLILFVSDFLKTFYINNKLEFNLLKL